MAREERLGRKGLGSVQVDQAQPRTRRRAGLLPRHLTLSRRCERHMRTTIEIRGARENNLKNVDVEIPRDKLVVVTGVSGSGKSSLAFDTVYAEGQRRLLASMSTFAKRFVGHLKKPDVDFVNGL